MPRLAPRSVLCAISAVALLAPASGGAPATSASSLAHGVTVTVAHSAASTSSLLLINGTRAVRRTQGGVTGTTFVQPSGPAHPGGPVLTMGTGGTTELVPADALPYVGHGLADSLFEVNGDLQRTESDGRLPVTLGYTGRAHTPPGLTVTHRGTGTETGYFTTASAARFGAALLRQFLADHAKGSYGSDGLFSGGLSVSLAGATAPAPAARPRFPMHTLTVTGTNLAGKPDTGDAVVLYDAGDPVAYSFASQETNVFYHGTAKYSVPTGTFWAIGEYVTNFHIRMDVLPQFTVTGDTSVSVSESAATSKVGFVTPRPATMQSLAFTMQRTDNDGPTFLGWNITAGWNLWVNTFSQPVSSGTLNTYMTAQLSSPASAKNQYAYTLNYVDPPGVLPAQRITVSQDSLATLDEDYTQDVAAAGSWSTWGGTPAEIKAVGYSTSPVPVNLPGPLVQYVSAQPSTLWQTWFNIDGGPLGGQSDAWRLYHPGERLNETWNAGPLHVAPNTSLPGAGMPATVSAARTGNTLVLDLTPFSDSTFGHTGSGFFGIPGFPGGPTGTVTVAENGTTIGSGPIGAGNADVLVTAALSATPGTVSVTLDASRQDTAPNLSGASQDVWTWPSQADPSATVPAPWNCGYTAAGTAPVRQCAVQSMIIPEYQVLGLSTADVAPSGAQALGLALTYLQGASPSAITQAQVQVSYDGGTTWQPATLSRTGTDGFRATYTAPASAEVSLQVTAQDSAGATVAETITNAYQTGS